MAYHTVVYLCVFLPIVLLLYQLTPQKKRWVVLLTAGYVFFWLISDKLVLYLMGTTLLCHYTGMWISWLRMRSIEEEAGLAKEEKKKIKKHYKSLQKAVLAGGILLLIAILIYLKYYNFFVENANSILKAFDAHSLLQAKKLIIPIGISFYTLQAIGYMADVYWEKIPVEQNLAKLALFLNFFPQIMEGPISMYSQTADALWSGNPITAANLSRGWIRVGWGLFKKMVIADRLYFLVQTVFDHYQNYSGAIIAIAAIAYTIQLYMEFSGCMDIVIGSGQMFGVTMPENFRQPFASKNAADFWRRWHITLGVWFKNYIFYPVSVSQMAKKWNRFGKKHFGKKITIIGISALALFPVWICNGLWHGAQWHYIFYGIYYFVIIMFGIIVEPVRTGVLKKFNLNESALYWRIPQRLKTWVIIFVGELFFRAETLGIGFSMFFSMFRNFDLKVLFDESILKLGLDMADFYVIIAGCIVVAIVGSIKERNLLGEEGLYGLKTPLRWAVYYCLIFGLMIFGAYGVGYQQVDLIYAGF